MKVKNLVTLLYFCRTEYRNLAKHFVFFSKVWQLKTPKTTIFLHFIFWLIHQKKKQWRQHALILLRPWFATQWHTNGYIGNHLKTDESQIGSSELWLNSSVDHGCNISIIIIIRFIKGWIVAWIQQSLFRSLYQRVNINLLIHVLCVVMVIASYKYIKIFIHKVQYIVMPLCKIMFVNKSMQNK